MSTLKTTEPSVGTGDLEIRVTRVVIAGSMFSPERKANLNEEASWDLPVVRGDDSWRSGNVVHNVCAEDDLQVLAAPVLLQWNWSPIP